MSRAIAGLMMTRRRFEEPGALETVAEHVMRLIAQQLLAAAIVGTCGCSFIAVRRPPPSPLAPGAALECTQSRVAPVLDTAGAIGTPVVGVAIWGLCSFASSMQTWSSDPSRLNCGALLWGTILSTATYTASAVYGYQATADCRRLAQQRRTTLPLSLETPAARRPRKGPPASDNRTSRKRRRAAVASGSSSPRNCSSGRWMSRRRRSLTAFPGARIMRTTGERRDE